MARRGFRWRRSAARDGLDISILQLGEGVFEVRSTNGDTHLSSDHFDQRIVDWLAEEFKRENGIDLQQDRLALQRLKEATERAKIELSSTTTTEINLPFITADAMGPKHLTTTLTRAKLEQLVGDLIERTADSLVYQAEKSLRDLGERVPADVRSDVQGRIAELKTAMQGRDVPAMRRASEELQRALRRIGERIYSQPAGAGIGGDGTTGTVEGAFREV